MTMSATSDGAPDAGLLSHSVVSEVPIQITNVIVPVPFNSGLLACIRHVLASPVLWSHSWKLPSQPALLSLTRLATDAQPTPDWPGRGD
jgi:hypothetical protein